MKHGLQQARALLQNQCVRWFTDSSNVVSIVRKGSMVPSLLKLALEIFTITKRYNINLAMTWISRDYNTKADLCSRIIEYDDWGIPPKWYAHIASKLGTPKRCFTIAGSIPIPHPVLTASRRTGAVISIGWYRQST